MSCSTSPIRSRSARPVARSPGSRPSTSTWPASRARNPPGSPAWWSCRRRSARAARRSPRARQRSSPRARLHRAVLFRSPSPRRRAGPGRSSRAGGVRGPARGRGHVRTHRTSMVMSRHRPVMQRYAVTPTRSVAARARAALNIVRSGRLDRQGDRHGDIAHGQRAGQGRTVHAFGTERDDRLPVGVGRRSERTLVSRCPFPVRKLAGSICTCTLESASGSATSIVPARIVKLPRIGASPNRCRVRT